MAEGGLYRPNSGGACCSNCASTRARHCTAPHALAPVPATLRYFGARTLYVQAQRYACFAQAAFYPTLQQPLAPCAFEAPP